MILKRLQATFGKLDGAVLTLQPGLNLLYAPNEGGKSTWCAFLLAMLYGIDASQRDSKAALADKHKYQPWSGKPMAGRIDLAWQGRAGPSNAAARRKRRSRFFALIIRTPARPSTSCRPQPAAKR